MRKPENIAALPLPDVQDGLANLVLKALVQHPKADTNLGPKPQTHLPARQVRSSYIHF